MNIKEQLQQKHTLLYEWSNAAIVAVFEGELYPFYAERRCSGLVVQ